MNQPWVWVDFNSVNAQHRLWLTCVGTRKDLERQQIELREGLPLTFYEEALDADGNKQLMVIHGVVERSVEEDCWVARVDWDELEYIPVESLHELNGTAGAP